MTTKFGYCLESLHKEAVSHQWLRNAVRKAKVSDDVGDAQTQMLKAYQRMAGPTIGQSRKDIIGMRGGTKRYTAAKTMEARMTKSIGEHGWKGKVGSAPPQQVPPKKKNQHIEAAKVIGSGLAGFGLGHLAGAGAGKLVEHFTGRKGGNPADMARKIVPIAGGLMGVVYPMWKAHEQKAVHDAVESAHNQSDGRVPGQQL